MIYLDLKTRLLPVDRTRRVGAVGRAAIPQGWHQMSWVEGAAAPRVLTLTWEVPSPFVHVLTAPFLTYGSSLDR